MRTRNMLAAAVLLLFWSPVVAAGGGSAAAESKKGKAQEGEREAETVDIGLPGESQEWAVECNLDGLSVLQCQVRPGAKKMRMMAANRETGFIVSINVEPAAGKGGAVAARKHYWKTIKKNPLPESDVSRGKMGSKPYVTYMVKSFRGRQVNQKNYNMYLSRKGIWVDVHLSMTGFTSGEEKMFTDFLRSVSIDEDPSPSAITEVMIGHAYYHRDRYEQAAKHYRKALDMRSDGAAWGTRLERTVVDQMGMACGISGQNKKAEKIFRDAIKDDPEYPMYHYNLACALAEQDKIEKAAPELVRAFELRENMMRGERIPNPQTDSSFRPHLNEPAFKEAMRKIHKMRQQQNSGGGRR